MINDVNYDEEMTEEEMKLEKYEKSFRHYYYDILLESKNPVKRAIAKHMLRVALDKLLKTL